MIRLENKYITAEFDPLGATLHRLYFGGLCVADTRFGFRLEKPYDGSFDHNFVLDSVRSDKPAAVLQGYRSGITIRFLQTVPVSGYTIRRGRSAWKQRISSMRYITRRFPARFCGLARCSAP